MSFLCFVDIFRRWKKFTVFWFWKNWTVRNLPSTNLGVSLQILQNWQIRLFYIGAKLVGEIESGKSFRWKFNLAEMQLNLRRLLQKHAVRFLGQKLVMQTRMYEMQSNAEHTTHSGVKIEKGAFNRVQLSALTIFWA